MYRALHGDMGEWVVAMTIRSHTEELRPNASGYEHLYQWFIISREVIEFNQEVLTITEKAECAKN